METAAPAHLSDPFVVCCYCGEELTDGKWLPMADGRACCRGCGRKHHPRLHPIAKLWPR